MNTKTPNPTPETKREKISDCCKSTMTVEGDTTHYYSCDNCGKPCDVSPNWNPTPETKREWMPLLDKVIRGALFEAWEAGKRQKDNPNVYSLDTDIIGKPLFDFITTQIELARQEGAKVTGETSDGYLHSTNSTTLERCLTPLDRLQALTQSHQAIEVLKN